MSKRGAGERDFTPAQGNMRKARVEVRRVDAFQVLMAAARARSDPQQQASAAGTAPGTGTAAGPGAPPIGLTAAAASGPSYLNPSAPCTHCGTVLPVSADTCSLRQCSACLDVFCSLCSVLDYEEREDRVFCLSCLDDQAAASRNPRGSSRGGEGTSGSGAATASMSLGLSLPVGGAAGRWGQLDMLGATACGVPARSPFPCSRTPQQGVQAGSRTPGSVLYSARSHRGFAGLLGYAGAES